MAVGIEDDGMTLKTNFSVRYFGKLPFTIVSFKEEGDSEGEGRGDWERNRNEGL